MMVVSTVLLILWFCLLAGLLVALAQRHYPLLVCGVGGLVVWTWIVLKLGTIDPILMAVGSDNALLVGFFILLIGLAWFILIRRGILPDNKKAGSRR